MQNRYWLFRRNNGVYYLQDRTTGRQESLKTRSREVAARYHTARNQAVEQPALNLGMAKVYLAGKSKDLIARTWQDAMAALEKCGGEANEQLLKEKADLRQQLSSEQAKASEHEKELRRHAELLEQKEKELTIHVENSSAREMTLAEKEAALEKERLEKEQHRQQLQESEAAVKLKTAQADESERKRIEAEAARNALQKEKEAKGKRDAVIVGIALAGVFEYLVHALSWKWLLLHPNSYGLQAGVDVLLMFAAAGLHYKPWRGWCWGIAVLALFGALFPLFGGPSKG